MNYRSGRAVRGLAARSAVIPFGHRTAAFSLVVAFFALLKKLGLAFGHPLPSLSLRPLRGL
ncbi:hypothetical protein SGRA_2202 [Saprospira grandis str. Lewin]|uniref:Uncharacterized protein n=1 Tax=Saprospira grandis (strain Lewin) TaxID=984262 RepID=H6L3I3_SAPGL|nr:hypothetical protein SGRA_2202 [Saprospira grandis str. Lewin]